MEDKIRNKVFICTNNKQLIGALVSKYTIERYSKTSKNLKVEIINSDDGGELDRLTDRQYLREKIPHTFDSNDLQTFTLLRFAPPELMCYEGRALVVDPDVFSTGADVTELLERDMEGNAILSRPGKLGQSWISSVMLLECNKLKHWSLAEIVDGLLALKIDYREQMDLQNETALVRPLEENWNQFDFIDGNTKLLHATQRITQPWKTGLPVDFLKDPTKKPKSVLGFIPREWIRRLVGRPSNSHYREHPDHKVKEFFFGHLKAAVDTGYIPFEAIRNAVEIKAVREDIFEVLDKTSPA